MPEKKTKADKRYSIDGRKFIWSPDVEEGETLPDVVLPLRMKLKQVRDLLDRPLDATAMSLVLEAVAPQHTETIGEMDLNDIQAMYVAWQDEYQNLAGATLGE